MDISSDDVLNAWLRLTTRINNPRMAGELPYNELLICGILYRNQKSSKPEYLTATDLCGRTRILKSQMNRRRYLHSSTSYSMSYTSSAQSQR